MPTVVTIQEKLDTLPFYLVLNWERYQLFCTDVLYKRRNAVDSRDYLSKGSPQHGIDIYVVQRGQKEFTVAQCKLEKYLGPADIIKIVDDFLKGQFVSETAEFILCTNVALKTEKVENVIHTVRGKLAAHSIDLVVWDEGGLSMELRTNPSAEYVEIVYHYFNEEICKAFFGDRWTVHIHGLQPAKKQYPASADYIERNLTSYEERLKKPSSTRWNFWDEEMPKQTLVDIVKVGSPGKPARIALLSTAGFGKSEELTQLASRFSGPDETIYSIKFSLGNYDGRDIEAILSKWNKDWQSIPEKNLLLILDAIDEIGKPADLTFYKKLNAFTELYPDVHVVVSSRFNFYEVIHQPLKGFSIYMLDPLNRMDIERYLYKQLGDDKEAFQNLVHKKGFADYQDNPYYLTRMVRFFKDDPTTFPANKSELFERILFEQLNKDQTTYQIPELRTKLYEVASRIAFCITLSGVTSLTDNELASIITDKETRTMLHNFAILRHDTGKQGSWSFEHKNMQEYLCANALRKLSFPQVQQIIAMEVDPNRVLPKFLNTISFLFELLDKNDPLFVQLFNWISSNEPELLIRFEREQIEKTTRNEIFFRLFASYKDKGLSLRTSSNFSFHELAAFTGVDETIVDFLSAEIVPSLPGGLLYDAVNIISLCERPFTIKPKISKILFDIIDSPEYSIEIKASCIRSFYYLQFTDRETFDRVFAFAVHEKHNDIRSATLSLLEHTAFQENFSDYIFENFREEAVASDERHFREAVKRMVLKFTSPEKIKDLIRFCAAHPKVISQHHSYRSLQFNMQETKDIIAKATAIYQSDHSIVPLMYRLYIRLEFLSMYKDWINLFLEFFEQTCGKERIFLKFYRFGRRPHDMLSFAEEKTCDFIIEELKNGNVSTKEGIIIRNVLSHVDQPLYRYLYEKMKLLPDADQFTADEDDTDYNAVRIAQAAKNQDKLLDKSSFLEEASEVFKAIGKDTITVRDLWFTETKALRRLQDSIALQNIRDVCQGDDDKEISEAEYFAKLREDIYWNGLLVESIKDLIESDRTKNTVRPELVNLLTEWTTKEVERIDFEKQTIIEHEGGGYSYYPHTEFVKQCVELLKPDFSDDLLIKLLKADYSSFYSLDTSGNEEEKRKPLASLIMEKVKDRERLRKELIGNIRDPKTAYRVRSTHFKICQILGFNDCISELYGAVMDHHTRDSFDRVKLSEIYVSLGGEWKDFSRLLAVPESPSYEKSFVDFHWHLLEKLLYEEKEKTTEILLEVLEKDEVETNRLKAAEFLIKLSRIEGLRYWLTHVTSKKGMLFENRWETFYDHIRKMPFDETVDIFIAALDSIYSMPLPNPEARFWRLDDTVFNSLVNMAIQGKSQLQYIEEQVEKLLDRTTRDDARYTIKYFRERIKSNYYQSITETTSIAEANEQYSRYLLHEPANT